MSNIESWEILLLSVVKDLASRQERHVSSQEIARITRLAVIAGMNGGGGMASLVIQREMGSRMFEWVDPLAWIAKWMRPRT